MTYTVNTVQYLRGKKSDMNDRFQYTYTVMLAGLNY